MGQVILIVAVIVLASLQVTARSEDPNGVALTGTRTVLAGAAGDLSQYRPLSHYVAVWVAALSGAVDPPYERIRLVQCLLIFSLAYLFYRQLAIGYRTSLVGVGLLAGLLSLNLGRLGPSTFSLDRFTDTIFYLLAALLVVRGIDLAVPLLMVVAVANRETSVFMPMLLVAKYWTSLLDWRGYWRQVLTVLSAWAIAAAVYLGIHAYYGPRPRTEESYFGPDMFLHSLSLTGQVAWLFAMLSLLPLLALLSLPVADPWLRRLWWLVVPVWLAIHIWAARLGEGVMYLAPMATIVIPIVLQGVERLGWQAAPAGQTAAPAA